MSDYEGHEAEDTTGVVSIYVLPTEEGMPPRAVIGEDMGDTISGSVAVWTADMGTWTMGGIPLPQELAEAISAHAGSLGVEGF